MASGPITSWEIDGETVETVPDFIFLGSKITTDGDCSHEIKPRRASGPGSGAESPSSRDTGRGRKGGRPLARHAPHVRGAPGAKPFVDDLLLGRGFVRSRAAPSLRSIESQPSTQGFVAPAGRPAGAAPAVAVEARATAPSLFSLRGPRLSVGGRRCVLGPGPGLGGVPSGGRGGPPSSAGQSCLALCEPMGCSTPGSSVQGDSPGKDTGVGCHALLQVIFQTQGSNPCVLCLLHCRQILYHLSHQRSQK